MIWLSFRTADCLKLWLPIISETDSGLQYLAVRNSSILLHLDRSEQGPYNYSQGPKVYSGSLMEQIYTKPMSQFLVSMPNNDKLVMLSLIVRCKLYMNIANMGVSTVNGREHIPKC